LYAIPEKTAERSDGFRVAFSGVNVHVVTLIFRQQVFIKSCRQCRIACPIGKCNCGGRVVKDSGLHIESIANCYRCWVRVKLKKLYTFEMILSIVGTCETGTGICDLMNTFYSLTVLR